MNPTLSIPLAAMLAIFSQGFAAQHPTPKPTPTPAEAVQALKAAVEGDPDPAMLRAMKSKVFEVKHRDPTWLASSLRALGSGVRGTRLDTTDQNGLKTLSVRDFPDNLAAIGEALTRLDVPTSATSAPDVEFHLHVLFAGPSPSGDNPLPEELQEVIRTLKHTLTYKHYTLGASLVQRARILEYNRSETGGLGYVLPQGLLPADAKDSPKLKVEWRAHGLSLDQQPDGTFIVGISRFTLDLTQESDTRVFTLAKFSTPLTLKDGERVVVGTSVVKDRGLIVVLTARLLK